MAITTPSSIVSKDRRGSSSRTESLDVHADGSVVVIPKGLIHREINTGEVRNRGIVVRVGFGLPVFPVDPASIGR